MVRQWQDMFFDERLSQMHLTHHVPDYAKLAEAYGGARASPSTTRTSSRRRSTRRSSSRPHRRRRLPRRPEEKCFPMIPAGAAALDIIEYAEATRPRWIA